MVPSGMSDIGDRIIEGFNDGWLIGSLLASHHKGFAGIARPESPILGADWQVLENQGFQPCVSEGCEIHYRTLVGWECQLPAED